MNKKNKKTSGENGTVTGWGRLSEGGQLPNKLQHVQVPIISNQKCRDMFLKSGRMEYIPEIVCPPKNIFFKKN